MIDLKTKSERGVGDAYVKAVHCAELFAYAFERDETETIRELYTNASYAYEREAGGNFTHFSLASIASIDCARKAGLKERAELLARFLLNS